MKNEVKVNSLMQSQVESILIKSVLLHLLFLPPPSFLRVCRSFPLERCSYNNLNIKKTIISNYRVGDKMPTRGQIHLKSWVNRKEVYKEYCADLDNCKNDCLHYSRFTSLWKHEFCHVVIPAVISLTLKKTILFLI